MLKNRMFKYIFSKTHEISADMDQESKIDEILNEVQQKSIIEDELRELDTEDKMDESSPGDENPEKDSGNLAHTIDEEINPFDRHVTS